MKNPGRDAGVIDEAFLLVTSSLILLFFPAPQCAGCSGEHSQVG